MCDYGKYVIVCRGHNYGTLLHSRRRLEETAAKRRGEKAAAKLNAYICDPCRAATKAKRAHPGTQHAPGICDCPCRGAA